MTIPKKIPLWIAILININIVAGGGFFLSSSNVFQLSGIFAPLTWIFCGLLLLPLVQVLAQLSRLYPMAGGLYVYSQKTLGDFWGFMSGWGYFIGTIAGNAIILHAFSGLLIAMGVNLPVLFLDIFFAIIFTFLNLANVTVLEKMHIGFTVLKAIPVALTIGALFILFNGKNIISAPVLPFGILQSMPIVLFAYLGIEACCAITHNIEDGERNSARAMLSSFAIIVSLYALVQFALLAIIGTKLGNPFFAIIPMLTTNTLVIKYGNFIVQFAILSSYLGGFYGMFYANSWNLYAIAKEKRMAFSDTFIALNKHHTPWVCILTQGILVIGFILVAIGSYTSLMTMSGFGVVIAYILSAITAITIANKSGSGKLIGILALLGSMLLLGFCINDLIQDGLQYLLPFLILLFSGFLLYRSE